MAMIRLSSGTYNNNKAIENVINYIFQSNFEITPAICGGCGVGFYDNKTIAKQFYYVKNFYDKKYGKQLIQFILTFDDYETERLTIRDYFEVGEIVSAIIGSDFQVLYSMHLVGHHKSLEWTRPHLHFVLNSVNFNTGMKFREGKSYFLAIQNIINIEINKKIRLCKSIEDLE